MKTKSLYFFSEVSNFIMVVLFNISVAQLWDLAYKKPFSPVLTIGVFLLLLYSYLLRKIFNDRSAFWNNIILYSVLHVILFVVIILIPIPVDYKALFFLLFIVYTILDIRNYFVKRGETFDEFSVMLVVVPAFDYLLADIFRLNFLMKIFFAIGVLYVGFFYLRLLLQNSYYLSMERKNNDKMPFKEMVGNDLKLSIPFILVTFAVMISARIEAMDRLFLFVYYKFASFLGFLIIKFLEIIEKIFEFLFGNDEEEIVMFNQLPEEIGEGSAAFNLISNIICTIIVIGILIFLIVTAIKAIRFIMQKREVATLTIENEDVVEIREKIVRKRPLKKENLSKIRKQYKKIVIKNIKKGYEIKKHHTPKERAEDIKNTMKNNIDEINELYEKDRYGQFGD
ncbi:MAG: hypothetical protein J5856_08650 [Lachnospiraceae bacterium]|nr:hypothetical protein [Lachnospiraceae bacterium]